MTKTKICQPHFELELEQSNAGDNLYVNNVLYIYINIYIYIHIIYIYMIYMDMDKCRRENVLRLYIIYLVYNKRFFYTRFCVNYDGKRLFFIIDYYFICNYWTPLHIYRENRFITKNKQTIIVYIYIFIFKYQNNNNKTHLTHQNISRKKQKHQNNSTERTFIGAVFVVAPFLLCKILFPKNNPPHLNTRNIHEIYVYVYI